jgi:hypothetical protein
MRASLMILGLLMFSLGAKAFGLIDSTQSKNEKGRHWYSPHFIPIQYAGNIGFISAGIGYEARKQNYQLSLVYGYVPKMFGGVTVHSVTAKNTFPLYRFFIDKKRILIPYGAIGLNVEIGGRSFLTLPDNMPAGYYDFPKSTHLIGSAGVKYKHIMNRRSIRAVEFFAELTTVDAYVWYKMKSDEVKMRQILSSAVGIHLMRR